MREDLDLAARKIRIDRALRPRAHQPGRGDDELVAQLLGDGESGDAIGIADDLHQPFSVTQVDEDDAAMIATTMHPAANGDGLVKAFAVDATAVVGAFQCLLRRVRLDVLLFDGQQGAIPRRRGCGGRCSRPGQFRISASGCGAAGGATRGGAS